VSSSDTTSRKSEQPGRLYIDHSDESREALRLLLASKWDITTIPITGTLGPELMFGPKIYYGIKEIRNLVTRDSRE